MEAVATDVFGVRGQLAIVVEQVYERDVVACRDAGNSGVPLLDCRDGCRLLTG